MTLAERDKRLARLEKLLEMCGDGAMDESFVLMETFRDKLWEVSDGSFEEFLGFEFPDTTPIKALAMVRQCASFDEYSESIVESLINKTSDEIDYQI